MSQYDKTDLYFLKLYDSFINSDAMIWVEQQENGKNIAYLLIKLMLIAKNRQGKLARIVGKMEIPYTIEEMAVEVRETKEIVINGLEVLMQAGLVEKEENIYKIPSALKYTNQTTKGAEKKRLQRRKKVDICPPEIEEDKETEKENRNKKLEKEERVIIKENDVFVEVIQHLNYILKTSYKVDNQEICLLIKERIAEGYTAEDMKNVIESRYNDWKDTKYSTGLRYQTLLGDKFGLYLEMYKEAHKYDYLYANLN